RRPPLAKIRPGLTCLKQKRADRGGPARLEAQLVSSNLSQATNLRRRAPKPITPPKAAIRPGSPAPTMGAGTTFIAPNSPSISPLIPSVKKRELGLPLLATAPKTT